MLQKTKQYFRKNFFSTSLPFEYRIYMIFFLECLFISIISAATNTILDKGLFGVLFQWVFILFCFIVLFLPLQKRMSISKLLLIITSFIYIPFLFFQTAGYDGTAGLFAVLCIFIMTITFQGKVRFWLLFSNICLWFAICTVQFFYPQLVTPHGAEQAKFMDYVVALVLSTTGMAILGIYFKNALEVESKRIRLLLKEVEKSNRSLEDLTNRDPLTGIYNRRYLTDFLARELKVSSEANTPLSLLMLDLDHFKEINDTHGHSLGDAVLMQFTRTVQKNIRKYDVFARFGGEEFILVLYGMSAEAAYETAERIRLSVSQISFENDIHITVSIGLVEAQKSDSVDSLINRADACMYAAKNNGRNQVVKEQ